MERAAPDSPRLLAALYLLTFVTGLIDAGSFLAMGRVFTANMTGNIVFLGFAFAGEPGLSVARSLTALVAAVLGGMIARRYVECAPWGEDNAWLVRALFSEAICLAVAALAAALGAMGPALYLVIALTALGMGVRNATVRHLAVPDMNTTVLTLTIAAMSFDLSLRPGENSRWRRRGSAVAIMFLGAVVGAILLRVSLAIVLAVSAALSLLCARIVKGGKAAE